MSTPRRYAGSRLKPTHSLSVEGAYLLVLVLGLGSFWFGSHLAACGGTLRGQRLRDAIFALPLCLIAGSPAVTRKELVSGMIFVTATQRTQLDCLALVASRADTCGSTGLCVFAYFKAAA